MVREAGGRVTTLDGRDYSVFDKSMLASNGRVHEEMMRHIEPRVAELQEEHAGLDLQSKWFIPQGYDVKNTGH